LESGQQFAPAPRVHLSSTFNRSSVYNADDDEGGGGVQRLVVTLCNFVTLWTIAGSRRELLRERHAAAALHCNETRLGTSAVDAAACTIVGDPYANELHAVQLQEAVHCRAANTMKR
jgi:hypothetical protein